MHHAESAVLEGENPFAVEAELDLPQDPPAGATNWSETWLFAVWSPRERVGLFLHAGTSAEDPWLWWAQTIAYLPDRVVIADRSWGRRTSGSGPTTGSLSISCEEPLRSWRLRFDGAGERTTSAAMGAALVGAGLAQPMTFDVTISALGPVWDLFAATGAGEQDWAAMHHEQNCRAAGTLTVDGRSWDIQGVCLRDRSRGPRHMDRIGSDRFWGMSSPTTGRSVQGVMVWDVEGEAMVASGSIHEGGKLELIQGDLAMTGVVDTVGRPETLTMTLERASGERIVAHGECLHCATIAVIDPNCNVNGTPSGGNPLVFTEAPVRFTWPDGDVLYGHLERGSRLSTLAIPDEALLAQTAAA